LYPSPSIIRIIKSRMMRWAGHVAWIGEKRKAHRLLVGKSGRPRHRWVNNTYKDRSWRGWMGWCGLDWSGSGEKQVESSCEFGTEPSGCIKCWETIVWPNNWWPL
jgi:hypothetical protein